MFHIDFSELPHNLDIVEDSGSSHSFIAVSESTGSICDAHPCP